MSQSDQLKIADKRVGHRTLVVLMALIGIFAFGFWAGPRAPVDGAKAETAGLSCGIPSGWNSVTDDSPRPKIAVGGLWKCAPQLSISGPFKDNEEAINEGGFEGSQFSSIGQDIAAMPSRRTCLSKETTFDRYCILVSQSNKTFLVKLEFADKKQRTIASAWLDSICFNSIEVIDQSGTDLLRQIEKINAEAIKALSWSN